MNLVVKEWALVSQRPGVLIVSETAGVADEIGNDALLVSPLDVEGTAAAMAQALTVPAEVRSARLENIRAGVWKWTSRDWLHAQLEALGVSLPDPPARGSTGGAVEPGVVETELRVLNRSGIHARQRRLLCAAPASLNAAWRSCAETRASREEHSRSAHRESESRGCFHPAREWRGRAGRCAEAGGTADQLRDDRRITGGRKQLVDAATERRGYSFLHAPWLALAEGGRQRGRCAGLRADVRREPGGAGMHALEREPFEETGDDSGGE
jgi:hypothetical protein